MLQAGLHNDEYLHFTVKKLAVSAQNEDTDQLAPTTFNYYERLSVLNMPHKEPFLTEQFSIMCQLQNSNTLATKHRQHGAKDSSRNHEYHIY